MPLVSGRFRLCSALPYQILESHLQALPWLLFAFLAGPFRIRSHPCASAGLVSNSARSGSCPSFSLSPPCHSWRIGSQQRHCASSLVSAELIRCHSTQVKSGLITSVAFRVLSMRIRSRQSPGSSAPPAPISAVPVRFPSAQFGTPPFPRYCSPIMSRRLRAIAYRLKSRRRGSFLFLFHPPRFVSTQVPSSAIRVFSVRRHSTRGLSVSLRGDSGMRTSLALLF